MTNHFQESSTTYQKPVLTKEEPKINEKKVSMQAESIVNTVAFPMVLKAALELGVIDTLVLTGDWLSPYEVAARLPTKPTNPEAPVLLDRMLRLLVSHSVLKCHMIETGESEMVYAAEPVCKFFLKDSNGSGSFLSAFMLLQSQVLFKAWMNLKDVILEGKDGFSSAHGMRIFEYIGLDEGFAEMFHRSMSDSSKMVMKKVLEEYKGFESVTNLVDVGGGKGTSLGLITSKYPHIKGVNFDSPHVLSNAPCCQGVVHVSGDMFIEVPRGDAIFMKWILHDWTDEHCKKILKNCWKSLPENGKVIIVDMVAPQGPKDDYASIVFGIDLLMLTHCSGGKERSLSQLKNLALEAGFVRCEVICLVYSYSVIELHK